MTSTQLADSNFDSRKFIELNSENLELGFKRSRQRVDKFFRDLKWTTGNLPAAQRRDLDAMLLHTIHVIELLNLQSDAGLPLDVWFEERDELNFALLNQYASVELMALVDVVRRHQIPKQFLFDPLSGADTWTRQRKFETYDELESFCGRVGGSLMLALMPILETTHEGYESAAIECGKGIMLTRLLAGCVNDARLNLIFLAQSDLQDCEIDLQRLKLRKSMPTLKHLVRLYCWRIEKCFQQGGQVLDYLDFDGRRTMTSVLSWYWIQMTKMQVDPESILLEEGVLTGTERLKLRAKHLLGLEGDLPFGGPVSNSH